MINYLVYKMNIVYISKNEFYNSPMYEIIKKKTIFNF